MAFSFHAIRSNVTVSGQTGKSRLPTRNSEEPKISVRKGKEVGSEINFFMADATFFPNIFPVQINCSGSNIN